MTNIYISFLCGVAFTSGGALVTGLIFLLLWVFKGDDEKEEIKARIKRDVHEACILDNWARNLILTEKKNALLQQIVVELANANHIHKGK